jgi:CubicO group peptidase (beta-lactamase class C family)
MHGWSAAGWQEVEEVFRRNFAERHEVGAAFAAYHRGDKVVDLWGGVADEQTGAPWQEDTVVLTFSTTKGAAAVVAALLVQRGQLDMTAPAAEYWPEFAAAGKENVTVEHLFSHQAGVPWVDVTLTVDEALAWDPVVRALEDQRPVWEPGTAHGYHATTYGWLAGEIVRRVTGATLGSVFRTEVAEPLGLDYWIGLPESEEGRVARLISILDAIASGRLAGGAAPGAGVSAGPAQDNAYLQALAQRAMEYLGPDGPLSKALSAPSGTLEAGDELLTSRKLHGAELPAFNGIGDARSLARMYAAVIGKVETDDGENVRLLDETTVDEATRQRTEGPDRVLLGLDIQFGRGFMVNSGILAGARLGSQRAFGHFGMGGSGAWADPHAELAMAYVMNRMDIGTTGDLRMFSLMRACYDVVSRR